MWQYTAGRSPLSQPPEQLMAIRSSNGFSHLQPGEFHIFFTNTQGTTYTTERVEEKRTNKHGLGLAPSARREKFVTLSKHSVLLWAIASVYSSEIPTKSPGTLTHLLTLANPASGSTVPSLLSLLLAALFCRLPWSVLSSVLLWDFAFPRPVPVSWLILHARHLCRFRTKTDKGILWLAYTHTHRNECSTSYLSLDYVLRTLIDLIKETGFTLKKIRRYQKKKY